MARMARADQDSDPLPRHPRADLDLHGLFPRSRVRALTRIRSQKAILREAAIVVASDCSTLDSREVLTQLQERERQGSTVMEGTGIAIPHCRMESCTQSLGALLRTAEEIDFGDGHADVFFVLVIPSNDRNNRKYLQILGAIADIYGNENAMIEELRAAPSDFALRAAFLRHMNSPVTA